MLCSVATLIHDTYLPVYLSEVLHLSNSKVRGGGAVGGGLYRRDGGGTPEAACRAPRVRMCWLVSWHGNVWRWQQPLP